MQVGGCCRRRVTKRLFRRLAVVVTGVAVIASSHAAGQWTLGESDAENDAIRYSRSAPADAVARLQRSLDSGSTTLAFDPARGYLHSVLQELHIPISSQALVFSRTSAQRALISPETPRALYFNDDVYVGWAQRGSVLEVASMDPQLGAVFYTLRQRETARPTFQRQLRCLQCHDLPALTGGVPGLIMKSVHADERGEPIVSLGTVVTSDATPWPQRWGGWYVTGTAGTHAHSGRNLGPRFDSTPYLGAQSDVVALMVLQHQIHLQNLMTRASYQTRMAESFDRARNRGLGRSLEYVPDSTRALVRGVAEPLVRAMLFVDEAPLADRLSGTSHFASEFAAEGPRDHQGRSLRDLDLTRRLFAYPCSYLIYSAAFDSLPSLVKDYVYRRLSAILNGEDASDAFAHLSDLDRRAMREILLDTKPDFAAWAAAGGSR